MNNNAEWIESKAKESTSQNFIKTVLGLSGYTVMDFGIENHNQEIIQQIKKNYSPDTNRKLMSMPDFVVVDNESKESWLVEVKQRNFKEYFDMGSSNITFKYRSMKAYLNFWKETTLILTFNVEPFCLCVDFNKINRGIHFKEEHKNSKGIPDELWNFEDIYQALDKKFPKVTTANFNKALHLSGIKKEE